MHNRENINTNENEIFLIFLTNIAFDRTFNVSQFQNFDLIKF